jgi:hypothetical protein
MTKKEERERETERERGKDHEMSNAVTMLCLDSCLGLFAEVMVFRGMCCDFAREGEKKGWVLRHGWIVV